MDGPGPQRQRHPGRAGSDPGELYRFFYPVRPVTVNWAETLTAPESREDYATDQAYVNFREVNVGNIAPGVLYRSSSPIAVSQGDRRFVADALLKETEVRTVVNTSDCRFRFKGFEGFDDTYYATLDHVALNMGHDYPSQAYLEDVRNGFDFMAEFAGPYLIHGTQGVERTGYVCMMLEALMGAGKEDILADYMRSYADYYQLSPDSETWAALEDQATGYLMLCTGIWNEAALDTVDLSQGVERYLTETVGLTPQQVADLQAHLAGK